MAFTLKLTPWSCVMRKGKDGEEWSEEFGRKDKLTLEEVNALSAEEQSDIYFQRNIFPNIPLVNFTTQYGLGVFEGLKAYPQKRGGVKLFRPIENARRMISSMAGLFMPVPDEEQLLRVFIEFTKRTADSGYVPKYDAIWEEENYLAAEALYLRPFTCSEEGISVQISVDPYIIVVATPVSGYFKTIGNDAVISNRARATVGGTGWIKSASNYVISALAKKEAEESGFMESIFVDAKEKAYIEEGSSCNFFCVLKDGTLVTPDVGDTILPGITRASILKMAKKNGIKTEERLLSLEEVFDSAAEVFVSGTAAGVTHLSSITHNGRKVFINDGTIGETTFAFQKELKNIQYGAIDDSYGWMVDVC